MDNLNWARRVINFNVTSNAKTGIQHSSTKAIERDR